MGHQGGIARFTGSLGELTFYFDDDRESVRWKSKWKKKKWLARREMWRQHNSARLFGAASVVASNLWVGMPAGLRRLADGSGYGRLVGRCNSLIGDDGQLWDADLLKGLELNEDALVPSVHFRLRENGAGAGIRLEGLDQLNRELDLALGDKAGTVPATFLVAHGLNRFGLGMNGLQLTAEEAQVKTAFREIGAPNSLSLSSGPECEGVFQGKLGLGARNSVSAEDGFRWPEASGMIGVRPEAAASNAKAAVSKPLKRPVQRRFRVWVNAVKVAETLWIPTQEKFRLDTSHGVDGVGYVTDWAQDFPDSLDLRSPFEGKRMEFDGEYVVYCALEVSEKRGRHWVRLPYCCRFRVVDLVAIENCNAIANAVENDTRVNNGELRMAEPSTKSIENVAVGGEEEGSEVSEQGSVMVDMAWKKGKSLRALSPLVEAAGREVLIEFKGPGVPCLDILQGIVLMGQDRAGHGMPLKGSGIRAGP